MNRNIKMTGVRLQITDRMIRIVRIIGIVWLLTAASVRANPVRKTIQVDGFKREYLVYTPSLPLAKKAAGVLVCLHSFGRSMNEFFDEYNIAPVADELNMIIVAPQALPEQNLVVNLKAAAIGSVTNNRISLNSVWGCGLRIRAVDLLFGMVLLNEVLNEDVNDVNFIDLMINEVQADYDLPAENIFVLGTSMGGYMTYQYALIKGERLSGIVAIAGSMGLDIKGMDSVTKIPVCDFHSVTDEVVPYAGASEQYLTKITLAKPKTEALNYWRETNRTGNPVTEQIRYYPPTNGITVEKITFPDPVNEVIHYKINGAPHNYFFKKENGDCMDYAEEVTRFIRLHLIGTTHNVWDEKKQRPLFYPNPVDEIIYFTMPDGVFTIYDLAGRTLLTQTIRNGQADLSRLKPGIYVIRIQAGNESHEIKLIKR